jgi:hypothetical protein
MKVPGGNPGGEKARLSSIGTGDHPGGGWKATPKSPANAARDSTIGRRSSNRRNGFPRKGLLSVDVLAAWSLLTFGGGGKGERAGPWRAQPDPLSLRLAPGGEIGAGLFLGGG